MTLWSCFFVFFPDLDGLVALCCNHSQRALVELDVEDGSLTGEGARLHGRLDLLEAVAALPVVELQDAVVTSADQDVVVVESQGVDDVTIIVVDCA